MRDGCVWKVGCEGQSKDKPHHHRKHRVSWFWSYTLWPFLCKMSNKSLVFPEHVCEISAQNASQIMCYGLSTLPLFAPHPQMSSYYIISPFLLILFHFLLFQLFPYCHCLVTTLLLSFVFRCPCFSSSHLISFIFFSHFLSTTDNVLWLVNFAPILL